MVNFWKVVNQILEKADIILEVLDSRLIDETRNKELEDKIKKKGKQIIYVLNKCDLVDKEELEKRKKDLFPCVFVSAKEHLGTTMLREKILRYAKTIPVIVGVVGYPNTGKSSIINALKGKRAAALTSSESGFTKGMQIVKADNKIKLLDSPGVVPFQEKDEVKHTLIGSINPSKLKDPDLVAYKLIEYAKSRIKQYYNIKGSDPEEILENIAIKLKKLRKGAEPDIETTARILIKDWQTGKIEQEESR